MKTEPAPVTSAAWRMNRTDLAVLARRAGELAVCVLASTEVMKAVSGIKVAPETYSALFLSVLFAVCQWCRYRLTSPPTAPGPASLPPMGEPPSDYSHQRHDLRIAGDTDEFFMRQAK